VTRKHGQCSVEEHPVVDLQRAVAETSAAMAAWERAVAIAALSTEGRALVYIVQCEDEFGPVKIGVSSNVPERIKALEAYNPYPLKLLALLSGGYLLEEALHRRFAQWRIRGEWFAYCSEIRALVAAVRDAEFSRGAA
jgi:hypothetical protein